MYKKNLSNSILFILMILLSSSCNIHGQVRNESTDQSSTEVSLGYKDFRLINIEKKYEDKASDEEIDTIGCRKWVLKTSDLKGILTNMKRVDPVEWNALCYHYPCFYTGKAISGGKIYEFYINAASYISLTRGDEKLYFIEEKKNKKFLIPCNCCE